MSGQKTRLVPRGAGSGGDSVEAHGAEAHDPVLAEATARRLLRLGFDLHDGALQSVVALGADLRLFRDQLASVLEGPHRSVLLGRVDDLDGRLVELERELRELAGSLEPTSLVSRPLREVIQAEVESFAARSGISTALTLAGALEDLTASQRLTVVRVVQEALTNAREHGEAANVSIEVAEDADGLRLVVEDDGRGFAVAAAIERAAADGRLGLAGMRERVALLGGEFGIDSRPGGPTVVSARLPRWRPAAGTPSA